MNEVSVASAEKDAREKRLRDLRSEAAQTGLLQETGIRPSGAPMPLNATASAGTGYYGEPLLKVPRWKWQVPIYFFTGGFAGASAVIASISRLTGADERLIRDARGLAAIGGNISPALLVADLGVPSRFLHMLRVFKIQSPMSVGSWTLFAFSSSSTALMFLGFLKRSPGNGVVRGALRVSENAAEFFSLIAGGVLSVYTGVLIGATTIPVWNRNVGILPIHFAASGMASAAALLELRGHREPALNRLGLASALAETVVGTSIEARKDPALNPLKKGRSGWLTRISGILSGPLPLVLRLVSLAASRRRKGALRKVAAASALAGSVITRVAWTQAGKASANDPGIPLELGSR